jgi:hypothetical protein
MVVKHHQVASAMTQTIASNIHGQLIGEQRLWFVSIESSQHRPIPITLNEPGAKPHGPVINFALHRITRFENSFQIVGGLSLSESTSQRGVLQATGRAIFRGVGTRVASTLTIIIDS